MVMFISAGAAVLAAGFWLWSALIHVPDLMQTALSGPDSITGIIKKQSRLSAAAAVFAAISALAQAYALVKG
jgi:hypothetical protein